LGIKKTGDTYYVLDYKWWCSLKSYINPDDDSSQYFPPGPIDNSKLMYINQRLKDHLIEAIDFVLISTPVWEKLLSWYGGGVPLPRKCISTKQSPIPVIEVYLFELKMTNSRDVNKSIDKLYSKITTIGTVKKGRMRRNEIRS